MSTWEALGFSASPYNVQPLRVNSESVPLLVGRADDGVRFCTFLDSAKEGVVVISGTPGVGKTSFLNVFQYLLEEGKAACGPRIVPARTLCPLQGEDTARTIALRVLQTTIRNVEEYCAIKQKKVPKQTELMAHWVGGRPQVSWDFSISVLGNGGGIGRSVHMPSVSEATFENINDALSVVVDEVTNELRAESLLIALDNVENLPDDRLAEVLMAFRDTLFSQKRVWWVIIGQSGLYSLIQALDARVTDRITGSGLELKPIQLSDLDAAVDQRVELLHIKRAGKAPLSAQLHDKLYAASFGEIRFVFKYCNTICLEVVAELRRRLIETRAGTNESVLHRAIGDIMTENHIPDELAIGTLQRIVESEISGLGLRIRDKQLLRSIGEAGSARSRDFERFGLSSSQDFSSNYLIRLSSLGLLRRRQEGRAAIYELRGLAFLAREFGLLDT